MAKQAEDSTSGAGAVVKQAEDSTSGAGAVAKQAEGSTVVLVQWLSRQRFHQWCWCSG